MSTELDRILTVLRANKDRVRAQYGISLLGVFGSVVRGAETDLSDVDVLIEDEGHGSLFDLVRLQAELEGPLNRRVDLVDRRLLRDSGRVHIEAGLVHL